MVEKVVVWDTVMGLDQLGGTRGPQERPVITEEAGTQDMVCDGVGWAGHELSIWSSERGGEQGQSRLCTGEKMQ